MIAGLFHDGSGLGNQLHRYIAVRCLAQDRGYEFGMKNPEKYKGKGFLNIDLGKSIDDLPNHFLERRTNHTDGVTDIRGYDERFENITDNTLIDGEFQDQKYFEKHKEDIRSWLNPKEFDLPENLCIINIRGGEYRTNTNLLIDPKFFENAIVNMKKVRADMQFHIVTDDVEWSILHFPEIPVSHDRDNDWLSIYNAHYLILSNSSFAIFPAWLNKNVKKIIAPMYWARHNVSTGYWALEQNIYDGWLYQDTAGNLQIFHDKKPGRIEPFQ